MLALAYSLGGEWKKAEELQLQVMETGKEVLGPEHPDTLTTMIIEHPLTECKSDARGAEACMSQRAGSLAGRCGKAVAVTGLAVMCEGDEYLYCIVFVMLDDA